MTLLHSARKLARRAGIDVQRATPLTDWALRLPRLLANYGVRTVLDVGANDGGYASDLLAGGFDGKILSFEPLPQAWRRLSERAAKHSNWEVAARLAFGNANGEAEFHEAGNSVSSSLLSMAEAHLAAAPQSRTVSTFKVKTQKLDDFLAGAGLEPGLFLKLDVQGAEGMVLEGAAEALRTSLVGVQLEMSLVTLYDSQPSAHELDSFLRRHGFECWDMLPGFRDPNSFRMLQYDAVYFRGWV